MSTLNAEYWWKTAAAFREFVTDRPAAATAARSAVRREDRELICEQVCVMLARWRNDAKTHEKAVFLWAVLGSLDARAALMQAVSEEFKRGN